MVKYKTQPLVYSPIKHRHALAARKINNPHPNILDVGGYKSREQYLAPFFEDLSYTSINIGSAWYPNEESHYVYDGNKLPFESNSFQYVISVDSLEHVEERRRASYIGEIIRVAKEKAVIVTPFSDAEISDEEYLLRYSERFGVEPMPSLAEHLKYHIPTIDALITYVSNYNYKMTFASPRHFYWSCQMAMLINTVVMQEEAEAINRRLYDFLEDALKTEDDSLKRQDAYRAILTIDKTETI
ncbi:MAG: methyltransferase domain-containing protein [Chloroflexi bacterium]|nr:methyltransferase domain-containing protein [Chloroflexota bacterium]